MERTVRRRLTILFVVVGLSVLGIGARLVYLQVGCSEELRQRAAGQQRREVPVNARRGTIYDREGRELAMSLEAKALYVHPPRLSRAEAADAARKLATVLELSESALLEKMQQNKTFVYLDRAIDPAREAAILALGLPLGDNAAFDFIPGSQRYYPHDRLAVHVIGFANVDNEGLEGIEKELDYELNGEPTRHVFLHDAHRGRRMETIRPTGKQPWDVVLTLDATLQHMVESELDLAMQETNARAASAVVLDPATGEVLALANRPAAGLERYGSSSADSRTNRAVVHQYEPGSTFKVVSMAAALEHNRVRPNQLFDCENGLFVYNKRTIRDISRNGILTAQQVLEESSNVGMAKIVLNMNGADLRETIAAFGFGERTGIGLPGELPGRLGALKDWTGQTIPSLGFGYEVNVTVLQMASALATVANDGVRLAPRVVLGIRDDRGVFTRSERPAPQRAISSRTVRELTAMMEGVVLRGSGTRARIPGYRIAGKSGTAHKWVDGDYSDSERIASFGGFAPISDPALVTLVVLDSPKGKHYGGETAAPVFRRIMETALPHVRAVADDHELNVAELRPSSGDSL